MSAGPDVRPSKRRRVPIACSACQQRKSKCDGRRPTCTHCSTSDILCEYDSRAAVPIATIQHDYLVALENRLRNVENALKSPETSLYDQSARPNVSRSDKIATLENSTPLPDATTDGMAITFVKEETTTYFGDSSNISFARDILVAIANTTNARIVLPADDAHVLEVSTILDSLAPTEPETTLPSSAEMERLLDVFFDTTVLLFPFVDEQSFRLTFSEFKSSNFRCVRRAWLALLNMVFAMASSIRPAYSGWAKASHTYYLRASALCGAFHHMQMISLETVQCLLLAVLYLQGSPESSQTWIMHGVLVRTATALGLHTQRACKGVDTLQQEIRRRTWLTIYCLDKVLGMVFGRPCAILDDMIVLEPTDASAEFLYHSVALYSIMGRCLTKQFGSNSGGDTADNLTTIQHVGEFRKEMQKWRSHLPVHLYLSADPLLLRETSKPNRMRVTMILRYHNLNILIHRPLLRILLRSCGSTQASDELQFVEAQIGECMLSAQATVDIVYAVLTGDAQDNNLGAWFFTLYYVFVASLTLFSSIIWHRYGSSIKNDAALSRASSTLTKATDALKPLDGIPRVQTCIKLIQLISGHLNEVPGLLAPGTPGGIDALLQEELPQGVFRYGSDFDDFLGLDIFNTSFIDAALPHEDRL